MRERLGKLPSPTLSANICGYQEQVVPCGKFQGCISTFAKLNGAAVKLSEVVPLAVAAGEEVDGGNFSMQFIGEDGDPMLVSDCAFIRKMTNGDAIINTYGSKTVLLIYYPTEPRDGYSAGWYLSADKWNSRTGKGFLYELGEMELEGTLGYTVYAGEDFSEGVKLVYSGAVRDKDVPYLMAPGKFSGSGNIAPTAMKLSEFIVQAKAEGEEVDGSNFSMQFIGADGDPMLVKDCPFIQALDNSTDIIAEYGTKTALLIFYPNEPRAGYAAGWYLSADKWNTRTQKGFLFLLNNLEIPAGQAFTVFAGEDFSEGATILLPNALK